jgi:hypothetical protein
VNENVENLILTQLREIRAAVDGVDRKVEALVGRVDALDERVDELDAKVDGLAGMIATLTGHFLRVEDRASALEGARD